MTASVDLAAYHRQGYLALPAFVPASECRDLMARAAELVAAWDREAVSIFSTQEQTRTSDDYFLDSGDKIRFFFEEDGAHLNKIGHALHDLDPVFDRFSRSPALAALASDIGLAEPLLLQSMYIFKGAGTGGEVSWHQDSTFLYTEPMTCVGFWFALEDATVDNGCLWALPGGHRGPLRSRFVRSPGGGTEFDHYDDSPLHDEMVPLEVEAGTCVVLHGLLPHRSGPNTSDHKRDAYSIHLIDGSARYPADNWLQRPPGMPLRGF